MRNREIHQTVDLDALATHLKDDIENKDLSIRSAAREIGCSAATLTRLLKGAGSETVPDSINLMRAASWLGRSLSDFEPGKAPKASSLAEVELHLRALPDIDKNDAEAIMAMVRAGYDLARKSKKSK